MSSGLGPSEKPHWFTRNTADADVESQSGKEWDSGDVRKRIAGTSNTEVTTSNRDDDDDEGPSITKRLCLFFISVMFLALFIYSVTVQEEDGDKYEWVFFYSFSAAIPALFLTHWMICFPDKIIYLLCLGMIGWSGTYIVIFSKRFNDDNTHDEDADIRREDIFEVGGACVACFSALYHVCVMCCCIRKKRD